MQCCPFGCNKRKKNKTAELGQLRSDSEGTSDDETATKRQHARTFHRYSTINKITVKFTCFIIRDTVFKGLWSVQVKTRKMVLCCMRLLTTSSIFDCLYFLFEYYKKMKTDSIYFWSPRFPADSSRKKILTAKILRKDWIPSSSSRICSDHFPESCFDRTGKMTKLKDGAIPTRFKGFPKHMQKVDNSTGPAFRLKPGFYMPWAWSY